MTLASRIVERAWRLPPARTRAIWVERNVRVPMQDGVTLLADRYVARDQEPVVLVRTPYRRRVFSLLARLFAERGYQVVVQNTRGTFGSGGTFDAFRDEQRDGLATLDWLAQQPWFGGSAAMCGPSYLGLTQWAVAAGAPAWLQALAIQVSGSSFHELLYPGGTFGLNGALTWTALMQFQEQPWPMLLAQLLRTQVTLPRGFKTLPLREADQHAVGSHVPYFQDWLLHSAADDPFWQVIDYSRTLADVSTPVNLVAGWHDIFLGRQLADYIALRAAGHQPYLTVGPWVHRSSGMLGAGMRESLAWFDAYVRGDTRRLRQQPVRIYVMGTNHWLDLPDWPPAAETVEWYPGPGGRLSAEPAPDSQPDEYLYDPRHPTPAVGGPLLAARRYIYDNRKLEARPDVLTYTSAALDRDLVLIGAMEVELHVSSSRPSADFFARLCDVEPSGRSLNVTDGVVRLTPPEWPTCVRIQLSPTAYCVRRGHRVRLQISSGAFPRLSRNTGSTEALGEAATLHAAHQQVWHDPAHPSLVRLGHMR